MLSAHRSKPFCNKSLLLDKFRLAPPSFGLFASVWFLVNTRQDWDDIELTVDCDLNGLDVCGDVVDGGAFVCPRSLSGDTGDVQVFVLRYQVKCEGKQQHEVR